MFKVSGLPHSVWSERKGRLWEVERSGWRNLTSGLALEKTKCLNSEIALVVVLNSWDRGRTGGFWVD